MKYKAIGALVAFLLATGFSLAGCKTVPETAQNMAPESSSIQATADGLAPNGDAAYKTLDFDLRFGNRTDVSAWTVQITGKGIIKRTMTGTQATVADTLVWDGKDDQGVLVDEGSYVAALTIEYGKIYAQKMVVSKSFLLALTPPSGQFSPDPAIFPYSPTGPKAPLIITVLSMPALAPIRDWELEIFDADNLPVKTLAGNQSNALVSWNGTMNNGKAMALDLTYRALLTVRDIFGNTGSYRGSFAVADKAAAPEASQLTTRRGGFSPTSLSVKNTLDFLTVFGVRSSVTSWNLTVQSATKGLIRKYSGNAKDLPAFVQWDGKDASGILAVQGPYFGILTVDYGTAYKSTQIKSPVISLVTQLPAGSVSVDPPSVDLAELDAKHPVTFTIQAKSPFAKLKVWNMTVTDKNGQDLALFHADWPNAKTVWAGKKTGPGALVPDAHYQIVAKVEDEYGNVGVLNGSLDTEALQNATETSSVMAKSTGFAPRLTPNSDMIGFDLVFGNPEAMADWHLDMVNSSGKTARSFTGTGKQLPASLAWNGRDEAGLMAPEGIYTARLALNYGFVYAPLAVVSNAFVLDTTAPTGVISLSTGLFSPDGDGIDDALTIKVVASSKLAKIVSQTIEVLDPQNASFAQFKAYGPTVEMTWDGKNKAGETVESASDYTIQVKIQDEFGNVGISTAPLPTDILVMKTDSGYRIRLSSIVFKAYTANYMDIPQDRADRNVARLNLLGKKLVKFGDYRINLVGHAVMINWDNKVLGDREQIDELIPLSKTRAEAIQQALTDRGITLSRLTIEGLGAVTPIVPDSDLTNRWKNRRVEFFILK